MNRINSLFLQGLAALVPVVLTLYAVYWLVSGLEGLLKPIVPSGYYFPGSGLVFGIVVIFVIGVLVDFFLFERLFSIGQRLLNRVPLVKTIYRAFSDLFSFVASGTDEGLTDVVAVEIGRDVSLIGFVTDRAPDDVVPEGAVGSWVAVYLPMSYMIGGYTALFPAERVKPLAISGEAAMRLILTGLIRAKR